MKWMRVYVGILILSLVLPSGANDLATLEKQYERGKEMLSTASKRLTLAQVLRRDAYEKRLAQAETKYTQDGNLIGVKAVRAEKERLANDDNAVLPEPLIERPAELARLQVYVAGQLKKDVAEYQAERAKIEAKLVPLLKTMVKEYVRANNVAKAEEINQEIEDLQAGVQGAAASSNGAEAIAKTTVAKTGLRRGMVCHYGFNQRLGETVTDESGDGNDAEIEGKPTQVRGKKGAALAFNGVDDAIFSKGYPLGGDFCIALWVKPEAAGKDMFLFEFGSFSTAYINHIWGSRSGEQWRFAGLSDARENPYTGEWLVAKSEWTHLTWNVSEKGQSQLYLNGQLKQQGAFKFPIPTLTRERHAFGKGYGYKFGSEKFFQGAMDEIMIWNRALSKEEIGAVYKSVGGIPGR